MRQPLKISSRSSRRQGASRTQSPVPLIPCLENEGLSMTESPLASSGGPPARGPRPPAGRTIGSTDGECHRDCASRARTESRHRLRLRPRCQSRRCSPHQSRRNNHAAVPANGISKPFAHLVSVTVFRPPDSLYQDRQARQVAFLRIPNCTWSGNH